jgi:hypothetical protein
MDTVRKPSGSEGHTPSSEPYKFYLNSVSIRLLNKSELLWHPKIFCCFQKCPPRVPILNDFSPVQTALTYMSKIYFNITPSYVQVFLLAIPPEELPQV